MVTLLPVGATIVSPLKTFLFKQFSRAIEDAGPYKRNGTQAVPHGNSSTGGETPPTDASRNL